MGCYVQGNQGRHKAIRKKKVFKIQISFFSFHVVGLHFLFDLQAWVAKMAVLCLFL